MTFAPCGLYAPQRRSNPSNRHARQAGSVRFCPKAFAHRHTVVVLIRRSMAIPGLRARAVFMSARQRRARPVLRWPERGGSPVAARNGSLNTRRMCVPAPPLPLGHLLPLNMPCSLVGAVASRMSGLKVMSKQGYASRLDRFGSVCRPVMSDQPSTEGAAPSSGAPRCRRSCR